MSSRPPVTPERWRQVKRVFAAALEVAPPARAATVDALCAGDDGLRDEVRSLLSAHGSLSQTGFPGLGLAPAARPLPDPEFPGNERFEVQARLGAGGFGVVYRALDRASGRAVALKVLREPDGLGLVRFKREFRALADLAHPNLVRLDELFAGGTNVFFTMELVDGAPIVEALRPARAAGDWDAVKRAFAGVVEGVRALHHQGLIHRDLKPSNVLLTEGRRTVILDFGLAASLHPLPGDVEAPAAGTPAYMAPEQFLAGGSSPASDWYAVGVMLYDLLGGRLPFAARFDQLIGLVDAKAQGAAPLDPGSVADVPAPLVHLCESWLASDAGARPGAEEALAVLAGRDSPPQTFVAAAPAATRTSARGATSPRQSTAQFVGREAQLAALRSAWARTRAGELSVVCLRGASGMGKTLLVRRFLDELRSPEALLLESCCHEREALPFKALDGVVDGLGQLLEHVPRAEAAALRPEGFEELERLFPVLRSKRRSAPEEAPEPAARDDGEQRRRAFSALRELLRRLGERRPVVLFIDDLQWGDDDSAALLRALLRPDRAPALLLVAACRQDVDVAPAFAGLLDALSSSGRCQQVSVEELEAEETRALAAALLGKEHPGIDAVVAEAGGVPFFVDTLVQEMREHAPSTVAPEAPHRPAAARLQRVARAL
ncbi:MAG TPA: serine/threonine-protein kinase, partial [Polyangia bacterium]